MTQQKRCISISKGWGFCNRAYEQVVDKLSFASHINAVRLVSVHFNWIT